MQYEVAGLGGAGGLAAVLGIGWLGLQIQPAAFPPYPDRAASGETLEIPQDLPAPLARYIRSTLGERLPRIESAVLSGRGRLRFSGITFPARLRFTHLAGRAYRHEIEATWFRLPLLRVNEAYLDGHARLELPFGAVAHEPKVDQGAKLALWGEELFGLPSVLFTDPRLRWQAIDDVMARLVIPFGETEDQFTVSFDAATGLLRRLQAPRYRTPSDATRILWWIEPMGWQTLGRLRLPSPVALSWQDEGSPWRVMTVEPVAYNVDVSTSIRSIGP